MHVRRVFWAACLATIALGAGANTVGRKPQGKPSADAATIANSLGSHRADEDMLQLLAAYASLRPHPLGKCDLATARANPSMADAVNLLLRQRARSTDPESRVLGVKSHEASVQGAEGPLPARVFVPAGAGPFPVVLYFHGGAWVLADREAYDDSARSLAYYAKSVVVSVDYRLAPEHKFPAAWDDALAAYAWILDNAPRLNADPTRVALAGESSGGTLALATAIAARDAGLTRPAHVLAIHPVTQTSTETPSYREHAAAPPLGRAAMDWAFAQLIRDPADLRDTRIRLIDADLSGLPPVTLISARIDPLRSDSDLLALALERAGVPVERRDFDGTTHDFFGAAAVVEKAASAQSFAGRRLAGAFAH